MLLIFFGCGISVLILSGPDESLMSDVYHLLLQEPSMKQFIESLNVQHRAASVLASIVPGAWLAVFRKVQVSS
jgi:hypothetical protein